MLVLSRKQSEGSNFAAKSASDVTYVHIQSDRSDSELRKRLHDLRNELNSANLAIHLSQKQIQIGRVKDADASLLLAMQSLAKLEQLVDEFEPKRLKSENAALESS